MKMSYFVGIILGCSAFMCVSVLILMQVSAYQAEPYMDEIFHIRQAQKYCAGRYNEVETW